MNFFPEPDCSTEFPAEVINSHDAKLPRWWGHPLNKLTPSISIVHNAFLSSGSIAGWPHSVIYKVETTSGDSIPESEFWRISRISKEPLNLIEQRTNASPLSGAYTYLGWLFGHYGHFITETLSRFWYTLAADSPRQFLVHANYKSFSEFPAHVVSMLSAFGIHEKNLTIITGPLRVENLHCPGPAVRCDYGSGSAIKPVYDRIGRELLIPSSDYPRKIYISRQSLPGDARQFNEAQVKTLFEDNGFTSINPQQLSCTEQISIYQSCTHIAGPVGSGMHNAVFLPSGGQALIIAPNGFLFKNDCLLSAAVCYSLKYFITKNSETADVSQAAWKVDNMALSHSLKTWINYQE